MDFAATAAAAAAVDFSGSPKVSGHASSVTAAPCHIPLSAPVCRGLAHGKVRRAYPGSNVASLHDFDAGIPALESCAVAAR